MGCQRRSERGRLRAGALEWQASRDGHLLTVSRLQIFQKLPYSGAHDTEAHAGSTACCFYGRLTSLCFYHLSLNQFLIVHLFSTSRTVSLLTLPTSISLPCLYLASLLLPVYTYRRVNMRSLLPPWIMTNRYFVIGLLAHDYVCDSSVLKS
jgi:hypothetical protein